MQTIHAISTFLFMMHISLFYSTGCLFFVMMKAIILLLNREKKYWHSFNIAILYVYWTIIKLTLAGELCLELHWVSCNYGGRSMDCIIGTIGARVHNKHKSYFAKDIW